MKTVLVRFAIVFALESCLSHLARSQEGGVRGERAMVVLQDGKVHEGTIRDFSPRRVTLKPPHTPTALSWPAKMIREVTIGKVRYVYNPVTDALEKQTHPEVITIEAPGTGTTETEALKDAVRNAVRQACGAIIDAETLVKNDEVIRDKILSLSDGIVTDYRLISSRSEKGIVNVRIRARVQPRLFLLKLKESQILAKDRAGKKVFSRLVSEIENENDGRALLERLFTDYPASVLTAEVVGQPKKAGGSDAQINVDYKVAVSVDLTKYQVFLGRLLPALDRIASKKGTCSFRSRRDAAGSSSFDKLFVPDGTRTARVAEDTAVMRLVASGFREGWWTRDFKADTHMVFVINTGRSDSNDVTTWTWYHVPRAELFPRSATVSIRFLDDRQKMITEESLVLGPLLPGYNRSLRYKTVTGDSPGAPLIILSPYFVKGMQFTRKIVLVRTLEASLDELRDIDRVVCDLANKRESHDAMEELTRQQFREVNQLDATSTETPRDQGRTEARGVSATNVTPRTEPRIRARTTGRWQ